MKFDNFTNKIWNELLVKWKHYPMDELHKKKNLTLRLISLILIIEDNDMFEEGECTNDHQLMNEQLLRASRMQSKVTP